VSKGEADKMGDDRRARDIDAALDTASRCRLDASIYRQLGFAVFAQWLSDNAKAAESWATRR
jgi:hypothetical protein